MDLSTASLSHVSIHFVGNKSLEQKLILSENTFKPDELLAAKLEGFFLTKFATVHEKFKFSHTTGLNFNEVYTFAQHILEDNSTFQDNSVGIARHLFETAQHPKIKPGELYVCLFRNCEINDRMVDAVGIFKTEVKNGYFDVQREKRDFKIDYKEGIDSTKFDKGCIIFNINPEDGFQVAIIDNQNRGEEAQYWKNSFLGLTQISNEFHQTKEFLSLTKQFISDQLTEEFEVERTDQIELLSRSVEYFKTRESFNKEEFESEVFRQPDLIESFRNFDGVYRETNDVAFEDGFGISEQAVKKQAKIFKSILMLDKNFSVYIHGNKEMIERGTDPDGRKYYKLYYLEEE